MTKHSQSMTHHIYLTHMANVIIDEETGKVSKYQQLSSHTKYKKIWKRSFANKLGRLAQWVVGNLGSTDTMFFISKDQFPKDQIKDVIYGRIIADFWPQKQEPHNMLLTVRGYLISNAGDGRTPTADITTSKIIINSTISASGERYMCYDI